MIKFLIKSGIVLSNILKLEKSCFIGEKKTVMKAEQRRIIAIHGALFLFFLAFNKLVSLSIGVFILLYYEIHKKKGFISIILLLLVSNANQL